MSKNRYFRDLRRITLARHLIEFEVSTQLICDFTGFSEQAIRALVRSYQGTEGAVTRHRGPVARRLVSLLASPALHCEASALAGIAQVMDAIPREPIPPGRKCPLSLEFGERLVRAFGVYHQAIPRGKLSMNRFIVLAQGLAEGRDVELGHCSVCGGALLQEREVHTPHVCPHCRKSGPNAFEAPGGAHEAAGPRDALAVGEEYQQPLF